MQAPVPTYPPQQGYPPQQPMYPPQPQGYPQQPGMPPAGQPIYAPPSPQGYPPQQPMPMPAAPMPAPQMGGQQMGNGTFGLQDFVTKYGGFHAQNMQQQQQGQPKFSKASSGVTCIFLNPGEFAWIKLGAMVAYTGDISFNRETISSQGLLRSLKEAVTGEGMELVKATARSRAMLYVADEGKKCVNIFLRPGEAVCVNGDDVIAFEQCVKWDVVRLRGIAGAMQGGFFSVKLQGPGHICAGCHGDPLVLPVRPGFPVTTDPDNTVLWSSTVSPQFKTDIKFKSLFGKNFSSGEEFQMNFNANSGVEGFVVVQPVQESQGSQRQPGRPQGGGISGLKSNENTPQTASTSAAAPARRQLFSGGGGSSHSGPKIPVWNMTDEQYEVWCDDVESVSLFAMGSKLHCQSNTASFSLSVVAAVFITVVIELATEHIEHSLDSPVTHQLINKIYKELMLMGLISFALQLLESFGLMETLFSSFTAPGEDVKEVTHRRVKVFEIVHILLFVMAMFYIVIVIISYFYVKALWRRWGSYENQHDERSALVQYQSVKDKYRKWPMIFRPLHFVNHVRLLIATDLVRFFSVRRRFLAVNKLKPNYPFSKYLKQRIQHLLLELISLEFSAWVVVLAIAAINYIRVNGVDMDSRATWSGVPTIIVLGFCCLAFSLFAVIWIHISYSKYIKDIHLEKVFKKEAAEDEADILTRQQSGVGGAGLKQLQQDPVAPGLDTLRNRSEGQDHEAPSRHQSFSRAGELRPLPMKRYLLLRSAQTSKLYLQLVILAQAFYYGFLLTHYTHIFLFEDSINIGLHWRILCYIFAYLPVLIVTFVTFPLVLAPFTILSSVDGASSKKAIKEAKNSHSHKHKHVEEPKYFEHRERVIDNKKWQQFVKLQARIEQFEKKQKKKQEVKKFGNQAIQQFKSFRKRLHLPAAHNRAPSELTQAMLDGQEEHTTGNTFDEPEDEGPQIVMHDTLEQDSLSGDNCIEQQKPVHM